ncbi:MAG TPA: PDZ domain-containing protein [Tepidisphaeraceae bacterium]|jgi:membrane-associated protease RseP (regulator of RpoE activity)
MRNFRAAAAATASLILGGTALAPTAQAQQQPPSHNKADIERMRAYELALEQARDNVANAGAPQSVTLYGNAAKKEKAAFLGVVTAPVTPAMREQLKLKKGIGLVVETVEKDSPAEQAGIRQYDIVTKIDDQWMVNANQLAVIIRMHNPGDEVKVTVVRQGQDTTLTAKLIEHEVASLDAGGSPWGVPGGDPWGESFVAPEGTMVFKGPLNLDTDQMLKSLRSDPMTLSMNDDEHTLTLTVREGHKHLTAVDRDGNVVFNGPIDTDEQRKAIPDALRAKVEKLESRPGTIRVRIDAKHGGGASTKPLEQQP